MGTVLRTEKNQTVRLFDGQGRTGLFVVIDFGRNKAVLQATELAEHPAPATGLTLAIGWGKSKRRNYLFEKTVELQGNGIVFWQAKRSQGRVPDQIKATWSDKCIQAAKQCGSVYLPELKTSVGGVAALVQLADAFDHCYIAWESDQISSPLSPFMLSKGRSLVVIGPEGGFDDAEAEKLIQASFKAVTLGRSILRWETAATYCLSLAMFGGQEV
ncbi:ribosomal RNA small subunit methyltransferase E [Pseudodesulfovibrio sediminis]|uniref:Ribosomal RNA small subunit methyltransferase E n=2 Tax=Pseudodesulfovibrio sediminis TaxID=2810563 RepID=A0ABM7P2W4_9BACT|nr:ribosomal RNA small subunit methyltransferase E [Pseudodesulfovibrio sediminis]